MISDAATVNLACRVIGHVVSPYRVHEGTPIQPHLAAGSPAEIHVHPAFREGLKDLEGFERIWIVAWLDRAKPCSLHVVPYKDTMERGIFATRSPSRPSPLGISCVTVIGMNAAEGIIEISGIDLLDQTPVLDIKPYVPEFDAFPSSRHGWYAGSEPRTTADSRFDSQQPRAKAKE